MLPEGRRKAAINICLTCGLAASDEGLSSFVAPVLAVASGEYPLKRCLALLAGQMLRRIQSVGPLDEPAAFSYYLFKVAVRPLGDC